MYSLFTPKNLGTPFPGRGVTGGFSLLVMLFLLGGSPMSAEIKKFYYGNDLSYVNQMEDCGGIYRENGIVKDPYQIMADHGTNLVRVRLWHDPWWQPLIPQTAPNAKPQYNDLADVIETITRAKAAGMQVMLDVHLSDFWADPGRQVIPRAWSTIANDDAALETAVHDYIRDVLTQLNALGLMPEIVKIGNETNPGLMIAQTLTASWNTATQQLDYTVGGITRNDNAHFARMWNAGIRAVREVGATATINPRIALHVSGLTPLVSFYDWMKSIGVTDFDIMGLSYYYAWHAGSIASMGNAIRQLKTKYPQYDVMVVETGYLWDQQNIDGLANIINTPDPAYLPVGQQSQRSYMVDLTQEVINAGGNGVIFWESAWISTACRTPWGVGSSHEHVAYFDHRNNNNFHVGGTWMEAAYTGLPPPPAITSQPAGTTALVGADVVLSVTATGANLTYQWRKNGVPLVGAVGSTLSLSGLTLAGAGNYSVVVTNGFGQVVSSLATLTINAPTTAPMITTQPVSQAIIAGNDVTFTVGASGNPAPTYQWKKGGVDIPGATNPTYTIAGTAAVSAGDYSCLATNSAGAVLSGIAQLSVILPPSGAVILITVQ